jgi:hypothetical protein
MRSVCIVELHITANNLEILSFAQKCFLWRIYVTSNNRTYLVLPVKCPILLSDFNQIWSFSIDFDKKSSISNFNEIRPVGAALIHVETREPARYALCATMRTRLTTTYYFFNDSTAPWGPRPPHFSRLHDHTLDTPHSVGLDE